MTNKKQTEHMYVFGVYFCSCKTLIIWYPDTKKFPNMDYFPDSIECPNCKKSIGPSEKLRINPERDLVSEFIRISSSYDFKHMLMVDESHVHFSWTRPNEMN
ncbi:MAG: hypothetical protein GF329_20570 [Candidatus Lokiarchaeota archaeon]|nr:hypothetical protein [Candidatus Lokiarchaeota archaeon]